MNYKTDIEAATIIDIAIDNYNENNALDKLIKYLTFNNRIIENIKYMNELNYNSRTMEFTSEMFEDIKNTTIIFLLFRSCALTEVDKLRKNLHTLKIDEIDGKPIDGINSEKELCDLIVNGLKVDIHKYDTFDYTKIKVAVRDDDDN